MGVEAIIRDPDTNPEKSHVNWLAHKLGDGWRWGPVKDAEKKEHPCMVPYNMLPDDQRIKDVLFTTTVRMMVPMLGITAVS